MKSIFVLFESDRGDSEVKAAATTEKKALQWCKDQFEKAMRRDKHIEQDEKINFDLIPDSWKLGESGFSYDTISYFFEELDLVGNEVSEQK